MTRERTDLRVRRTHALLQKTLIDLIAEKGFDAVTVGDIAERAMVNRSTFYRHFPDKYALVTSIFEDAVDQAISELGQEHLQALNWMAEAPGVEAEREVSLERQRALTAWVALFEHFAKHAKLYQTMLGKQGSSWFTIQMRTYVAEVLYQRSQLSHQKMLQKRADESAIPEEVMIVCVANWFVGMVTWWLESGMMASPQEVAMWCVRFLAHGSFQTKSLRGESSTEINMTQNIGT